MSEDKAEAADRAVQEFLGSHQGWPILDVRSPAEFRKGHIPGAVSFPVFDNDERHTVGLLYKTRGRQAAIDLGLRILGPRLATVMARARKIAGEARGVRVYCWRGGMRSDSMSWLLKFGGMRVARLDGGYKSFRRFASRVLEQPAPIKIVGGMTGSGKTELLMALRRHGQQVIDLEGLANHRGSAFGGLGQPRQPTNEQFENRLAVCWAALDRTRAVWLEDESRRLGYCSIPGGLWLQMRAAMVYELVVPERCRIERLLKDYQHLDLTELKSAVRNLEKRVGRERMVEALADLDAGRFRSTAENLLIYYDKAYRRSMSKRSPDSFIAVVSSDGSIKELALQLLGGVIDRDQESSERAI